MTWSAPNGTIRFAHVCGAPSQLERIPRIGKLNFYRSLEDLKRYATDLANLPCMYNGDLAPTQEVAALGYRLMICGSTIWLVYKQLREAVEELQHTGRVNPERYGTRWDV